MKKDHLRTTRELTLTTWIPVALIIWVFILMTCSCTPDAYVTCNRCYITSTIIRCDTTLTTIVVEPLKCEWTPDEISQYERKNTLVMDEKCFFLIQTCNCILIDSIYKPKL